MKASAGGGGFWIRGLVLLLVAVPGQTQEVPEGQFVEAMEVSEVLLDVLVTDKTGRVILGLGANDFEVEEEGQPVEITGLTFYSSRQLMAPKQDLERQGLKVDEVVEDRYFIVFLQQQRRAAGEVPGLLGRQMEAVRDVGDWVAEDLRPRDWVAVAVFETRLEVIQDFTNNIEDLQQAISIAAQGQSARRNWPSRQPRVVDGPSLLRNLPAGKELGKATQDIYEALQVLARATAPIRGRVNLLFFGRGVGQRNNFGLWEPDSRFYGPTIETLNDHNIAVYPLSVMPQGSRYTLEQSLHSLAGETGGVYHRQFTSFTTPLGMIADENGGYYLLSYESRKQPQESGFQRVTVKLRNPELVVRARKGYLYGE